MWACLCVLYQMAVHNASNVRYVSMLASLSMSSIIVMWGLKCLLQGVHFYSDNDNTHVFPDGALAMEACSLFPLLPPLPRPPPYTGPYQVLVIIYMHSPGCASWHGTTGMHNTV